MNTQTQALRTALVQQQKRVKELDRLKQEAEDDRSKAQVRAHRVSTTRTAWQQAKNCLLEPSKRVPAGASGACRRLGVSALQPLHSCEQLACQLVWRAA